MRGPPRPRHTRAPGQVESPGPPGASKNRLNRGPPPPAACDYARPRRVPSQGEALANRCLPPVTPLYLVYARPGVPDMAKAWLAPPSLSASPTTFFPAKLTRAPHIGYTIRRLCASEPNRYTRASMGVWGKRGACKESRASRRLRPKGERAKTPRPAAGLRAKGGPGGPVGGSRGRVRMRVGTRGGTGGHRGGVEAEGGTRGGDGGKLGSCSSRPAENTRRSRWRWILITGLLHQATVGYRRCPLALLFVRRRPDDGVEVSPPKHKPRSDSVCVRNGYVAAAA